MQRSEPVGTVGTKQAGYLASLARSLQPSERELGTEALAFCGETVDALGRRETARYFDPPHARRSAV